MARALDPQKRQAILEAARRTFIKEGYSNTRIADIAEQAGVAAGTVYLYFDSKEAMSTALAEEFLQKVAKNIEQYVPKFAHKGGIEAYISSVIEIAGQEREVIVQMRADMFKTGDENKKQARLKLISIMAERLKPLMEQKKIRRYNPEALANLIFGALHSLIMSCVIFQDLDLEEHKKATITFLQHALFEEGKTP